MRYGIIRISPRLPAPEDQRRRIEAVGCDVVFEERSHAPSGQNILLPLLQRLTLGDQVIVHSLEVFEATVGDLTRTLRAFNDSGVTLRLVGGGEVETLEPVRPTPRALTLLADYEERHPTRPTTHRRARAEPSTLTSHQLKFARDMQPELADRFVAMWVNDMTLDYGDRGREAVKRLMAEGHKAGIIPNKVKIDFVD